MNTEKGIKSMNQKIYYDHCYLAYLLRSCKLYMPECQEHYIHIYLYQLTNIRNQLLGHKIEFILHDRLYYR